MSLGTAVVAFAAGFISVLVFHQGVWALYSAAGRAPSPAWNMAAVPPLGVPMVADSGPSRIPIPAHRGQRSGDRGQFLTVVQA